MMYLSVKEIALKWGVSERSVRNYCAAGRVPGAFQTGKTWSIPADALLPERSNKKQYSQYTLLNILKEQKDMRLKGGIYHRVQVEMTYNSNHMEGSRLTEEQTRLIFETNTIGVTDQQVNVDDVIETANHFRCIDFVIEKATHKRLSESFIKEVHLMLKSGTSDSRKEWFRVGAYKQFPNEVGLEDTCPPEQVADCMKDLLAAYNAIERKTLEDIVSFHHDFECIHPFQDGNGRVGRLIMFKECLSNGIVPFIIDDELKNFYYRGLHEWNRAHEYLLDTCRTAQDNFKSILRYFQIKVE